MKFTKSSKPSDIPFGIYNVDKEYIKALRKDDKAFLDPDISNIYCGPLYHSDTERGPIDFFVPLCENFYDLNYEIKFRQDTVRNLFMFNRMVPCVSKTLITENSQYPSLTENVIKCRNALEECAEYAVNHKPIPKPKYTLEYLTEEYPASDNKSHLPFGIYNIDKNYILSLKTNNKSVLDPEITVRYCGPVYHSETKNGTVDFFVPVDPAWHASETYFLSLMNGVYSLYFDFKKLIPCKSDTYITPNNSDTALNQFVTWRKDDMLSFASDIFAEYNKLRQTK